VFTPLLFPTGRLLSPRWRLVAWPAAAVMAAIIALAALQETIELAPGRMVANPFGLAGVENPEDSRLGAVLFPLLGPLVLARSPRWSSGSGARGATNANSSSGSPSLPPCSR
jgi:hypothetical protein